MAILRVFLVASASLVVSCASSRQVADEQQALLAQISAKQDEIGAKQDEIGAKQDEINAKQTEIDARQDEIKAKLDALEQKLDTIPARQGASAGPRVDPLVVYKVPVGDAHARGPSTAKITIIEWADFQCPFSNRVRRTLEQLARDYGKDVRIVFKHNPLGFHPRALPAAIAAEAAGRQGKFWEMHDKLFANPRELTDENFVQWARELRLDLRKFERDLQDPALRKKIDDQQQEAATFGARGTPSFFVNGRFLSGAQPLETFKKFVDEEQARAKKLLDSGTPPNQLYDELTENGKTSA